MSMYDEYQEARNEALFNKLNELEKIEIVQMILKNSSDTYLEAMFQVLCG